MEPGQALADNKIVALHHLTLSPSVLTTPTEESVPLLLNTQEKQELQIQTVRLVTGVVLCLYPKPLLVGIAQTFFGQREPTILSQLVARFAMVLYKQALARMILIIM